MVDSQSDQTSIFDRAIDVVLCVVTLSHVAVAIHEAGHALAVMLCGSCVTLVRVGEGRLLLSTSVNGTTIEVRAVPMSGLVAHSIEKNRPYANIASYLAGPVASFAWMMLLASVWTPSLWPSIAFAVVLLVSGCDGDFASAARHVLRTRRLRYFGLFAKYRNARSVWFAKRRFRRQESARSLGRRIIASR